jgi:non-ribosomal peptide synthetase component E (peptide arylation enzyme)
MKGRARHSSAGIWSDRAFADAAREAARRMRDEINAALADRK